MESTVDPMVLGPLMIIATTVWLAAMSWAGMHEDDTPRRPTRAPRQGDPGPWWTNAGFDLSEGFALTREPASVPVAAQRRDR